MNNLVHHRLKRPMGVGELCIVATRSKTEGADFRQDHHYRLTRIVASTRYAISETLEGPVADGWAKSGDGGPLIRAYALPRGFRSREAWNDWVAAGSKRWRVK